MPRLQVILVFLGVGVVWFLISTLYAQVGLPNSLPGAGVGTVIPRGDPLTPFAPTSEALLKQFIIDRASMPTPGEIYPIIAIDTPLAAPIDSPASTPTQTPMPTSTSTPVAIATSIPTRYITREYWEQLPNGSYRYVRKLSDGTYEVVSTGAVPYKETAAAEATPAPRDQPRSQVREVWEKHSDGLFYNYRDWSDGTRELIRNPVSGRVSVHSSQGPYGVKVHVSQGYVLYGCLGYKGSVVIYPPWNANVPVARSEVAGGCVSYQSPQAGYYTLFFTTDSSVHPGYFWFDIGQGR